MNTEKSINKSGDNRNTENNIWFSLNLSVLRSLLGHVAPTTQVPLLHPIDENKLNTTSKSNNKRDNNKWFSSIFSALQNDDTIADSSSAIHKSTAVSATITNIHDETSVVEKLGKKKKHMSIKRIVNTSQNDVSLPKIKHIMIMCTNALKY